VPILPRKLWRSGVGSSYGLRHPTGRPISALPSNCTVIATPCVSGVPGISRRGSRGFKMRRGRGGRDAFPPSDQVAVLSVATAQPAAAPCRATRWSLDDMLIVLRQQHPGWVMSRASLWRILEAADLKPHRSVYWLNSHDPAFDAKAQDICQLYVNALRFYEHGRLVICTDEKTGMQILQRTYPTQPAQPGKPEKREYEYIRHGARVLLASFVVPTGQVLWNLGRTRTSEDFAAHLANVKQQLPAMARYDWVVDNLNTHWSLDVCELVATWCALPFVPKALQRGEQRRAFLSDLTHTHVLHFTPIHGSWLNQVELWFSVLARRFLKRGDFGSPEDFETHLMDYLDVYNTHHAHPYRWTYTGQPLVRATPFSQTRRQQRQGRAWFSPRPQRFARALYPPRPYKRAATPLVRNL
jgi:DDE superfamily endonuclease